MKDVDTSNKITLSKSRVKQAVDDYLADGSSDASLIFEDFKRIQEAFKILKVCAVL